MPKERFFIDQTFLENNYLLLEDKEFHHLINVMRSKIQDKVEVINGKGALGIAEVISIEKRRATLQIQLIHELPPPNCEIILAQAIPRPNRLDTILEKCTELGVTDIWLFPGDFSEIKDFKENKMERIQTILISAIKQCGRLYLPKVSFKPKLDQWSPLDFKAYFGDVDPNAPLFLEDFNQNSSSKKVLFFIGPESGFSEKESNILRKLNAKGVKLHENILRTDTAAITAIALMTHTLKNSL